MKMGLGNVARKANMSGKKLMKKTNKASVGVVKKGGF